MRALFDVNVLIALLDLAHPHQKLRCPGSKPTSRTAGRPARSPGTGVFASCRSHRPASGDARL